MIICALKYREGRNFSTATKLSYFLLWLDATFNYKNLNNSTNFHNILTCSNKTRTKKFIPTKISYILHTNCLYKKEKNSVTSITKFYVTSHFEKLLILPTMRDYISRA